MYLLDFRRTALFFYSVMGYEKFITGRQLNSILSKNGIRLRDLLDFWEEEIRKILQTRVKDESFKVIFSAHSVPVLALDFEDPYSDLLKTHSWLHIGWALLHLTIPILGRAKRY